MSVCMKLLFLLSFSASALKIHSGVTARNSRTTGVACVYDHPHSWNESLKSIFFINHHNATKRRAFMENNLRESFFTYGYDVKRWEASSLTEDQPHNYMAFSTGKPNSVA